jgi:hypothetical protein
VNFPLPADQDDVVVSWVRNRMQRRSIFDRPMEKRRARRKGSEEVEKVLTLVTRAQLSPKFTTTKTTFLSKLLAMATKEVSTTNDWPIPYLSVPR